MRSSFKKMVTIIVCLIICVTAAAQTSWHYLPNNGYSIVDTDQIARSEDIYFTDQLTGYCVTLSGYILKTTDGGVSWLPSFAAHHGPQFARFRSIEFLNDGVTGFAGSLNGYAFRTTDAGAAWVSATDSIPDTMASDGPRNICGLAHLGDMFYGVGWWGGRHARFYKSPDKGITWHTTYIDTAIATNLVDVFFTSLDTGFAVGGINTTDTYYNSTKAVVLKTTDGGTSWRQVFIDTLIGGRIWKIQQVEPGLLVGSLEPYLYPDTVNMIRSVDGGETWDMIHVGRVTDTGGSWGEQGVGFVSPMRGFIGGYFHGMFQTYDGGVTWDTLSFGLNTNRIFVLDSTHAYAGGQQVYWWGRGRTADVPAPNLPLRTTNKLHPIVPNPAKGDITISFDIGRTTNVVLEVAGVDSRRRQLIARGEMSAGHYTYTWHSGNAASGNYIIWLGTDEIPLVQQFVLIR